MRKLLVASLLVVSCLASAAGPEDVERLLDFSLTTAGLSELVAAGKFDQIDPERLLILNGTVASTLVFDENPETYLALVELVDARWDGPASISVHRVYVLLEGPAFAPRLPARVPAEAGPDLIAPNRQLLVIARFEGVADDLRDPYLPPVPVVLAIAIR